MRSRLFHAVIATGIALGAVTVACGDDARPAPENSGTTDAAVDPLHTDSAAEANPSDPGDGDASSDAGDTTDAGADADAGDGDAGEIADAAIDVDGGWHTTK